MDNRADTIINEILRVEGGYVNDPVDRGGATNFGITEAVARANGYHGRMEDMPVEFARMVYKNRYIVVPSFDKVMAINEQIGFELIDTGVNMGPARASEFLQRWLNGFNSERRYSDLFVDGRIGPITLRTLRTFLLWRGEGGHIAMLRGLNAIQGTRYLEITEARPDQRRFLYGWVTHRVTMEYRQ